MLDYARFDHADVFFWAVMSGEFELAKLFWPLTARPLAIAMLGSHVCRYMVGEIFIGKDTVAAQSEVMQDWVVGTLDAIPEQRIAHVNAQVAGIDNADLDAVVARALLTGGDDDTIAAKGVKSVTFAVPRALVAAPAPMHAAVLLDGMAQPIWLVTSA